MRKHVALILVISLLLGLSLLFAACGSEAPGHIFTSPQTEKESLPDEEPYELPEGYLLYTKGPISFAYPESWETVKGGSIDVIASLVISEEEIGEEYITVSYSVNAVAPEDITTEWYLERLEAKLDQMNAQVDGFTVTHRTSSAGVSVAVAEYCLVRGGSSFDQTQYVVKGRGNTYYFITLNLGGAYEELYEIVLESLRVKKGY